MSASSHIHVSKFVCAVSLSFWDWPFPSWCGWWSPCSSTVYNMYSWN